MSSDTQSKVGVRHLKRSAFLHVRQSSLRQVFENSESTKRQYNLRQRAISLGWQVDQVIIIDSDQGQSGKSSADREGFQRLVTEVSLGRVGIVMGLEVSRLARNSSDWHRLLEICALTDTLVLDDDGPYDPAHLNDRLLLGLKGTMSEAELHVMRAPWLPPWVVTQSTHEVHYAAQAFCQGEAGAIGLSRMPMARNRRVTTAP
jgi:hypothetical protein